MDRSLLDLPVELQVSIFSLLADLDDAQSLSYTCRVLRSVYTTFERTIKRLIITRSPVYEYDLCLSNLLHAWEDAARVLREYDGDVPHELRLSGSVCLNCFEKDYTNTPLTDVDVDEISQRWRKLGIIRDLYLDEAISRDFEKYRIQCVSQWPEYLEPNGIRPIIEESPELVIQSSPIHKYAPDFKARFHQSLCLHSIARAIQCHALYSCVQPDTGNNRPNLIDERLSYIFDDLWDVYQIVLNGRPIQLRDHAQFDCVEISDFLYYFLLEKVVPFSALESWTIEAADRFSYDSIADNLESWFSLLYHCRLTLQPLDIVDLVKHKTWRADSNFPADKTKYMYERAHFELQEHGNAHYDTFREFRQSHCALGNKINQHKSCSSDELRIDFGSPFSPGFRQMLDLEASKVESGKDRSSNL